MLDGPEDATYGIRVEVSVSSKRFVAEQMRVNRRCIWSKKRTAEWHSETAFWARNDFVWKPTLRCETKEVLLAHPFDLEIGCQRRTVLHHLPVQKGIPAFQRVGREYPVAMRPQQVVRQHHLVTDIERAIKPVSASDGLALKCESLPLRLSRT